MRSTSIAAVGDLMLGDSAITVGFGFASRYRAGLGALVESVWSLLAGADIVFGNLECVLSQIGRNGGSWAAQQMRGLPGYAPGLRRAGFTVLNVANNHANQHGVQAFEQTVDLLRKAGVAVCGLRGRDGWCAQPVVLSIADARDVGILGYCLRPRQYEETREPPFAEGDAEMIQQDIMRLRTTVDNVVVSLHWGEEFVALPSEGEASFARSLVDAGASVVLGHHPHVVRPVEAYRSAIVAYSLGNFISDMVWQPSLRIGLVLRCELGTLGVAKAALQRVRINSDYVPRVNGTWPIVDGVCPLDEATYREATRRTVSQQRARAYAYALRSLHKYPARVLRELVMTTLGNKIRALHSFLTGRSHGPE